MILLLVACATPPAPPPASAPPQPTAGASAAPAPREETVQDLSAALSLDRTVVIDVRTPEEYAGGHVPGAVNIPLDQVETRASEIPAGAHVICAAGGRSAKAASLLASKGIATVNVTGGTNAWVAAGLPVEK